MNSVISIVFYIILAIVGIICLYNAYEMKSKGNLKIGWFVGQNITKEKCKDIPGFIEATYKPIVIFGTIVVIVSVALIILEGLNGSRYIQLAALLGFIILYFWFTHKLNKATEKYLK